MSQMLFEKKPEDEGTNEETNEIEKISGNSNSFLINKEIKIGLFTIPEKSVVVIKDAKKKGYEIVYDHKKITINNDKDIDSVRKIFFSETSNVDKKKDAESIGEIEEENEKEENISTSNEKSELNLQEINFEQKIEDIKPLLQGLEKMDGFRKKELEDSREKIYAFFNETKIEKDDAINSSLKEKLIKIKEELAPLNVEIKNRLKKAKEAEKQNGKHNSIKNSTETKAEPEKEEKTEEEILNDYLIDCKKNQTLLRVSDDGNQTFEIISSDAEISKGGTVKLKNIETGGVKEATMKKDYLYEINHYDTNKEDLNSLSKSIAHNRELFDESGLNTNAIEGLIAEISDKISEKNIKDVDITEYPAIIKALKIISEKNILEDKNTDAENEPSEESSLVLFETLTKLAENKDLTNEFENNIDKYEMFLESLRNGDLDDSFENQNQKDFFIVQLERIITLMREIIDAKNSDVNEINSKKLEIKSIRSELTGIIQELSKNNLLTAENEPLEIENDEENRKIAKEIEESIESRLLSVADYNEVINKINKLLDNNTETGTENDINEIRDMITKVQENFQEKLDDKTFTISLVESALLASNFHELIDRLEKLETSNHQNEEFSIEENVSKESTSELSVDQDIAKEPVMTPESGEPEAQEMGEGQRIESERYQRYSEILETLKETNLRVNTNKANLSLEDQALVEELGLGGNLSEEQIEKAKQAIKLGTLETATAMNIYGAEIASSLEANSFEKRMEILDGTMMALKAQKMKLELALLDAELKVKNRIELGTEKMRATDSLKEAVSNRQTTESPAGENSNEDILKEINDMNSEKTIRNVFQVMATISGFQQYGNDDLKKDFKENILDKFKDRTKSNEIRQNCTKMIKAIGASNDISNEQKRIGTEFWKKISEIVRKTKEEKTEKIGFFKKITSFLKL